MSIFDDILGKVAQEDRAVLDRYPELKQSMERLEGDLGKYAQYAGQWMNWQKENWDADAGMTVAEKVLRDQLAEAQSKLATAAAPNSGASAAEIAGLEKKFNEKLEQVSQNSLRTIEGMNRFWGRMSRRVVTHEKEFGENFDPDAVLKVMQDNGINDPDIAYDKLVAPKRAEIAANKAKEVETQHAADITAAEQRGYEKRAQELAMGPQGVLPTDSTGGIAGVTARMDKPAQLSEETQKRFAEAKGGDGSLAQLGYEMYRRGELPVQ